MSRAKCGFRITARSICRSDIICRRNCCKTLQWSRRSLRRRQSSGIAGKGSLTNKEETMSAQASVVLAPPFTKETAIQKVRVIEDNWNSRNPQKVAGGYAENAYWRN